MSPADDAEGQAIAEGDGQDTAAAEPAAITFPYSYTLLYPVQLKGRDGTVIKSVSSITLLRRPKGKDLRATDKAEGDAGKAILLIASISGELPMVIDELDSEDIAALGELLGGSSPNGRPTGATASGT